MRPETRGIILGNAVENVTVQLKIDLISSTVKFHPFTQCLAEKLIPDFLARFSLTPSMMFIKNLIQANALKNPVSSGRDCLVHVSTMTCYRVCFLFFSATFLGLR